MKDIIEKLRGGDLRSIGNANEVAQEILGSPNLFQIVFNGIADEDPVIRMRCADAVQKASELKPELLQPYYERLINEISKIDQQEVQWHVAQMFSVIEPTDKERKIMMEILFTYLNSSKSKIVQVFSMQALTDIAVKYPPIKQRVKIKIEEVMREGSPALRSRGKKLLKKLNNNLA